ncbi:MAG TPA: hypothetical protein P5079_09380 [Elusimicrobiota bacterium]|nr:hypothetical protein [Elusimicrobiota bacterium]
MKKEKPRVVIVEEENTFSGLAGYLPKFRYDVRALSFSEEAAGQAAGWKPHVVVSNLPGAAALKICRGLRGGPGGPALRLLCLVGSRAEMEFLKAFQAEANAYLVKPVDELAFTTQIDELFEERSAG